MKQVLYYELCKIIAKDHNIDPNKKVIMYKEDFPIVNGVRKINTYAKSVIVDNEGNEFPYMLNRDMRNDSKLEDFKYIYYTQGKNMREILKEADIEIKQEPCTISEGGGWSSQGTKYYYKNFYARAGYRDEEYKPKTK